MSKLLGIIALAPLLATPALADSAVPDLRGIWKGTSESIVLGAGNSHHSPAQAADAEFRSVTFTLTVTRQEGRRFVGTFTSPKANEIVIGIVSRAGSIHMADDDGIDSVTLLAPDRLEICYLHLSADSRVVSCTEMTRQR